MCGIFGQATNDPSKINQDAVKILGMMNESRGKHTCGITYDGEIFHGLEKEKLFTDFAKHRNFNVQKYPIIFGHTRQSSVGVINKQNAHPFGYGNTEDKDFEFLFVHNGTLFDYEELADEYGVELKENYISEYNVELSRTKIDSEILGEILYKSGNVKVLSEYLGRAALVWTDLKDPNTIYLWSGKSKKYDTSKETDLHEERPLHVYLESENNFYFSSLPEGLEIIGGSDEEIFQIDYNTVYKVTNGDFKNAEKIVVSRKENYHIETGFGRFPKHNVFHTSKNNSNPHINGYSSKVTRRSTAFKEKNKTKTIPTSSGGPLSIYNDIPSISQDTQESRIYSKQLRFFQSGTLFTGICIYIEGFGFYELAKTIKESFKRYREIKDLKFIGDEFEDYKSLSEVENYQGDLFIPFPSIADLRPDFHFFVEGVYLDKILDFKIVSKQYNNLKKGEYLDYVKVSHCSKIPIIDISTHKSHTDQEIMFEGQKYSGTIDCLGLGKKYSVLNGNLMSSVSITQNKIQSVSLVSNTPKYDSKLLKKCETHLNDYESAIELTNKDLKSQEDELFMQSLHDEQEMRDNQIVKEEIVQSIIDEQSVIAINALVTCVDKIGKYDTKNSKEFSDVCVKINDIIETFLNEG